MLDKQQIQDMCAAISEELDKEFNRDSASLFKMYGQDPQQFDAEGMMFFALSESRRYTERYICEALCKLLAQDSRRDG